MERIAKRRNLKVLETGDNALSLVAEGEETRMDLLVPGDGLIPVAAARLIHERAVGTDVGRAAIPEHILVMKAVAHGDCVGKGRPARALEYESDVHQLRRIDHAWDEGLVRGLLACFPDSRRGPAVRLLRRAFGFDLDEPFDPNV